MIRKLLAVTAFVLAVGVAPASACWDHTDRLIEKLKKVNPTIVQLQDIFEYQQQHRDLIAHSHEEGLGCSTHERAEADFEKAAIGVLTDAQFEDLTGRPRNETETLRYENYTLRKELARLQQEIARLQEQIAALGG